MSRAMRQLRVCRQCDFLSESQQWGLRMFFKCGWGMGWLKAKEWKSKLEPEECRMPGCVIVFEEK